MAAPAEDGGVHIIKQRTYMADQPNIYSESYKIRSDEIHPNGKASLQTVCNLFQEAAGNHALQLNFDITQLKDRNLTWVLYRLNAQMQRYPEWRETVTVQTWPSRGDRLRAYRDYRLLDADDNELGHGLSYWLMIDLDSRRPVRMPQEVIDMGVKGVEHVIPVRTDRLKAPKEVERKRPFSVRRSDLDVNRHVNNVKYIEWALEAVPEAVYQNREVQEIDIQFEAESHYGDEIISACTLADTDNDLTEVQHAVRRTSDDKVVSVARSVWR